MKKKEIIKLITKMVSMCEKATATILLNGNPLIEYNIPYSIYISKTDQNKISCKICFDNEYELSFVYKDSKEGK